MSMIYVLKDRKKNIDSAIPMRLMDKRNLNKQNLK